MYGSIKQIEVGSMIRLELRLKLIEAINRLKGYNDPELDSLINRHIEALEYILNIKSASFLINNQFYSVAHILKLKNSPWNGTSK